MNFEDYKNMKNSSHQENFSAKGLAKTAKQATEVIKKLAHTGWNLGEKELKAASRNKTMHSITRPIAFGTAPITSTVRAILGKPTTKYAKLAKELQKKGELKNLIGRGAILGTGAGVISISALIDSSGIDDSKYYIFNEETSTIIGSKSGYKTKAEALKVRDEKYPGERINLGKTLKLKYKGDKNFSEMQNFNVVGSMKGFFKSVKSPGKIRLSATEAQSIRSGKKTLDDILSNRQDTLWKIGSSTGTTNTPKTMDLNKPKSVRRIGNNDGAASYHYGVNSGYSADDLNSWSRGPNERIRSARTVAKNGHYEPTKVTDVTKIKTPEQIQQLKDAGILKHNERSLDWKNWDNDAY